MSHLSDEDKEIICSEEERANISNKEYWYKKRDYCIDTCEKCSELTMLKKIYWELRKEK